MRNRGRKLKYNRLGLITFPQSESNFGSAYWRWAEGNGEGGRKEAVYGLLVKRALPHSLHSGWVASVWAVSYRVGPPRQTFHPS